MAFCYRSLKGLQSARNNHCGRRGITELVQLRSQVHSWVLEGDVCYQNGSHRVKIKVLAVLCYLRSLWGKSAPQPIPASRDYMNSLAQHLTSLHALSCLQIFSSDSNSSASCFPCKDPWLHWAHPDNPGLSPHAEILNLTTSAKSLLRFWGFGYWHLCGQIFCLPQFIYFFVIYTFGVICKKSLPNLRFWIFSPNLLIFSKLTETLSFRLKGINQQKHWVSSFIFFYEFHSLSSNI